MQLVLVILELSIAVIGTFAVLISIFMRWVSDKLLIFVGIVDSLRAYLQIIEKEIFL